MFNQLFSKFSLLVFVVITSSMIQVWAVEDEKKQPVSQLEDLLYKNTLYHYYSGDYISALTRILVNEKRLLANTEADRTKILQGGIYLAYGLDYDAKRIFEVLNTESLDEELRNVIWFYLGKDFYNNFDYANAGDSLERITKDASYNNKQEKYNILSNSYVYTNQIEKLENLLSKGHFDDDDKTYVKFNLAIAYLKNKQNQKGTKLLREISDKKIKNVMHSTISDKAKLHLANMSFNDKKYKEAIKYINEMDAKGLYSDGAIYLSALSHSILGNTRKAYSLLSTLKARESRNIYKYYSVLLIARILEQNGDYVEALNILNNGLSSISISKQELNDLLDKIRKDFFLSDLSMTKDGEIVVTNKNYKKLVDELVFSKSFASSYNNYIDLLALRKTINHWERQIPQLSIMLKERDRYFKEKKSKVSTTQFIKNKNTFSDRLVKLKAQFSEVNKHQDATLLYTDNELEYADDLEYVEEKVNRLSKHEDLSDVKFKVRIMKGLNYWQSATDYQPRLWDVKSSIKETEAELKTLSDRILSLQKAAGSEFHYQYHARNIQAMSGRMERLRKVLDGTIVRLKEHLVLVASEELDRRFKGIDAYYKAFKYDIARVSDRIMLNEKP